MLLIWTGALLVWREVDGTRRSVHEEIAASSRVAVQILQVVEEGPADRSLALLQRMGRVRATELSVYDTQGVRLYTSPPSRYKVGRDAPAWFAALVSPSLAAQVIALPGARLEVRPDPSRAIVDGWDDFVNLMA